MSSKTRTKPAGGGAPPPAASTSFGSSRRAVLLVFSLAAIALFVGRNLSRAARQPRLDWSSLTAAAIFFEATTATTTASSGGANNSTYLIPVPPHPNDGGGEATTGDEGTDNSNSGCFRHNSREWWEGTRYGNIDDDGGGGRMDFDFVRRMILDVPGMFSVQSSDDTGKGGSTAAAGTAAPLPAVEQYLGQSLCHEHSPFRNVGDSTSEHRHDWKVKLIYLAALYHQQRLAVPEAEARLERPSICAEELESRGIGPYDFECPSAKYIVSSLPPVGLGIDVNAAMAVPLLASLASDRILVLANSLPHPHVRRVGLAGIFVDRTWPLVSCDRGDYQCVFMPPTPCVLTKADYDNSYTLSLGERGNLVNRARLPKGHEDDKVRIWIFVLSLLCCREPEIRLMMILYIRCSPSSLQVWIWNFNGMPVRKILPQHAERLRNHSLELLESLTESDPRLPVLRQAADDILEHQAAEFERMDIPLQFLFLRPNLRVARQIDGVMADMSKGIDPENAIGLPIRGT